MFRGCTVALNHAPHVLLKLGCHCHQTPVFASEISNRKATPEGCNRISQTLGIADVLNYSHKWWMFLVIYKMEAPSKYFSFFETVFLLNSPGWVQTCDLQFSASWVLWWSASATMPCSFTGFQFSLPKIHYLTREMAPQLRTWLLFQRTWVLFPPPGSSTEPGDHILAGFLKESFPVKSGLSSLPHRTI